MIYLIPPDRAERGDAIKAGKVGMLITPANGFGECAAFSEFAPWGADNQCYTLAETFDLAKYMKWLTNFSEQSRSNCLFAPAPDVVGDWEETLVRSIPVLRDIRELGFSAALVAQDGATVESLPFGEFDVLFVGGTDQFKLGAAWDLIPPCNARGIWCHMGRVNSRKRLRAAAAGGYKSADGTYVRFGTKVNLPKVLSWQEQVRTQKSLFE